MSTTIPSSPAASDPGGYPATARATPTTVTPTTLSVPALMGELPVIRMLTEVVAMHGGCTLDQVSDLKLAVDQICTLLIEVAGPRPTVSNGESWRYLRTPSLRAKCLLRTGRQRRRGSN